MRIRWSRGARADLRDLRDHIAKDSPYHARQFVSMLIASVETLTTHPHIGRRPPETDRNDVGELIFRDYRIIYLLRTEHLYVVSVIHGSRDPAGRQPKPWEVV